MHYYKVKCSYDGNKTTYYISSENELKADAEGYIPLPVSLVERFFRDYTFIKDIEEIDYDEWVKNQIEN